MWEGLAAAGASGLIQGATAGALQSPSQDFAEKLAKKGIRWRVKDLRAAGLNPILAARGALGGGLPGHGTPSAGGVPSPATAQQHLEQSRVARAERQRVEATRDRGSFRPGAPRPGRPL